MVGERTIVRAEVSDPLNCRDKCPIHENIIDSGAAVDVRAWRDPKAVKEGVDEVSFPEEGAKVSIS